MRPDSTPCPNCGKTCSKDEPHVEQTPFFLNGAASRFGGIQYVHKACAAAEEADYERRKAAAKKRREEKRAARSKDPANAYLNKVFFEN